MLEKVRERHYFVFKREGARAPPQTTFVYIKGFKREYEA